MGAYFTPKVTNVTVAAAGTRVQLTSSSPTPCRSIIIQANSGNTGDIYIGGVTVSSSVYGIRLTKGSSITISNDLNDAKIDLSGFYIDAGTSADGISILYL